MRRRILYFTICSFVDGQTTNGGNLYTQNNVRQMLEDQNLEVSVLVFNPEANRAPTAAYFDRLGVQHTFGAIHPLAVHPVPRTFYGSMRLAYKVAFAMPHELESWNQPHLEHLANHAVNQSATAA